MKSYLIILFSLFSFLLSAQSASNKVEFIGDNEKAYEKMLLQCADPLLLIANNSMDAAYKMWTSMLVEMEKSATAYGIDIKGVKVWMNMFWEADGTIKKIVYYPKPTSKNMNFEKLTEFLEVFASEYNLNVEHDQCFSHYGSATFPVFTNISIPNEK